MYEVRYFMSGASHNYHLHRSPFQLLLLMQVIDTDPFFTFHHVNAFQDGEKVQALW